MSKYIIKQGDCLELMKKIPNKSIDMILTDPPYELENHGGGKTELATRKLVKEKHIDFISKGFNYNDVFNEFLRVCKIPNIFIFCSNKQVSKVMKWFEDKKLSTTLLVWNKTNPSPLCNGKYLSDCEFIVYVRGSGATFNNDTPFEFKKQVYTSPVLSKKQRFHPTQKPLELLERYMLLHSNKDDIVLDPFTGSGSTGVACMNTNRKFIGFELDESYYDIAKKRIEEVVDSQKKLY